MATKPLEVLGIGSLSEHRFLVYFSDQTYATVSSRHLAHLFPQRQAIPASVTEDLFAESTFHASHAHLPHAPHNADSPHNHSR